MDIQVTPDAIERSIVIDAPRERVWRALTDTDEVSTWFGADLRGQRFVPGQRVRGPITHCGYEHVHFDVVVERVEPQDVLAYRWHPYPVDPAIDYDAETPTLVTFTLRDGPDGSTHVTVVESGFDRVPPERRLEAFRMNDGGWAAQLENLARHAGQA